MSGLRRAICYAIGHQWMRWRTVSQATERVPATSGGHFQTTDGLGNVQDYGLSIPPQPAMQQRKCRRCDVAEHRPVPTRYSRKLARQANAADTTQGTP